MAFLDELCYSEWALKFQKSMLFLLSSLLSAHASDISFLSYCSVSCLLSSTMLLIDSTTLWKPEPQLYSFFYKFAWSWCFAKAIQK